MRMLTRSSEHDAGLTTLPDRVSRLFDDLFGETLYTGQERVWVPAVDVMETPDALLVEVELPGVDPKTVETSVTGEHLEISGSSPVKEKTEDVAWYRFERHTGAFRRRIRLPFPVDTDKIRAEAKHGLLQIRLPKRPEVLPKKIDVKVSS